MRRSCRLLAVIAAVIMVAFTLGTVANPSRALATAPPPAPEGLSVSVAGTGTLYVSWFEVDYTASFVVTVTDGQTYYVGAGQLSISISGFPEGISVGVTVQAVNVYGYSGVAGPAYATTPLSAPAGLTAYAQSPTTVVVSWADTSAGSASFTVTAGSQTLSTGPGVTSATFHVSPGTYLCTSVDAYTQYANSGTVSGPCVTTPVPDPSGVAAFVLSDSSVVVDWQDNTGGAAQDYVSDGSQTLSVGSTTSYTWNNLPAGTQTCFTVQAYTPAASSNWSPQACATTPLSAPAGLVAASSSPGTVNLSWADFDTGNIQFSLSDGSQTLTLGPGTSSYTWTGLPTGVQECFTITAFTPQVTSASSAVACAVTPVAAPSGVTASVGGPGNVYVTWFDNSGGTAQFDVSDGSGSESTGQGITSLDYTGLSAGTSYCFSVMALTGSQSSPWVSGPCVITTLPGPTNVSATVYSPYSSTISWSDNSGGVADYVISNGLTSSTLPPGTTSFTWTQGEQPGTHMCFTVQAVTSATQSDVSPQVCTDTPAPVSPPSAPARVTATVSDFGAVYVTWTGDASADTYVVSDGGTTRSVAAPTTVFDWTGVPAGTQKCFTVTAQNSAGSSPPSAQVCASMPNLPPVPAGLTATPSAAGTIHLAWTGDPGSAQYIVNNGSTTHTVEAPGSSYDWTGVPAGTQICFTVTAQNAAGSSPPSGQVCATALNLPGTPFAVTATPAGNGTVHITWNGDLTDSSEFTTSQYIISNGSTTATVALPNPTVYDWTGVPAGTRMCFTVTAQDSIGSSPPSVPACVGPGAPYAIIGDSYSAGEGTGDYDPGTATPADTCHRSPHAFGRVYADSQPPLQPPQDYACSGAQIANLTTSGQNGEAAQISQIDPASTLVTVTIGGNDAGFASVLTRCLTPLLSCEPYYTQDDANNLDAIIDGLRPQLAAAYTQIKTQAPHARVVAITYPNIFAPDRTCLEIGSIGGNMSSADVEFLIGETMHLDDVIVDAAHDAGISVLDERYAFMGHELCSNASPEWVTGLPAVGIGLPRPPAGRGVSVFDTSSWFHPTSDGQAKIAADLSAFLAGQSGAVNPAAVPQALGVPLTSPRPGTPSAELALRMLQGMNIGATYNSAGYARTNFADWVFQPADPVTGRPRCETDRVVFWRDNEAAAPSPPTCDPVGGKWHTPYDDPATTACPVPIDWDASYSGLGSCKLNADHLIPLKDAWSNGAAGWTQAERDKFSNDYDDSLELITVTGTTNFSKSDSSIENWQPPNLAYACTYAESWIAVKWEYGLGIDNTIQDAKTGQTEFSYLTGLLGSGNCGPPGSATAPPAYTPFLAVAGPGCPADSTRGFSTTTPWTANATGSWTNDGCSGAFQSQTVSGSATPTSSASWSFNPGVDMTCAFRVYVPNTSATIAGGNPASYDVLSGTPSAVIGNFTVAQPANRARWVNVGVFPETGGQITIRLNDNGTGTSSVAAAAVRAYCA